MSDPLRCDACLQPIAGDHYHGHDRLGNEVRLHRDCRDKRQEAEIEFLYGRLRSLTCDLETLLRRYPT